MDIEQIVFDQTSHLKLGNYLPESLTLDIFFKNRDVGYRFFDVAVEKKDGLKHAPHPGSYLQQEIMPKCRALKLECAKCHQAVDTPDVVIGEQKGTRFAIHAKCA